MKTLNPNEKIKTQSRGLRGNLAEDIKVSVTGALNKDNQQIIKFHGSYMQDNRDRRAERENKKLEWAYSYMIRLRIPGGDISAQQWIGIQNVADRYASGTIKITTRQTVQVHGVVKSRLKPTIQDFADLNLDSIAACGDVNRNVMAGSFPSLSAHHAEIHSFAEHISQHLLPKTKAYSEVWLDGEKLSGEEPVENDPLYQDRYLPRKFKIAIAIPPHNETDVYAHDIGLVAIIDKNKFTGFNVIVGGGMGMTHGNDSTYPRVGSVIGFIEKDKTLDTVWQIAAVQRDFGNREDRKLSRLKYTLDKMGVERFQQELESRLGWKLLPAPSFEFKSRGDIFGFIQDHQGLWHYGIFIENGVVNEPYKTGLLKLAKTGLCGFRFTANQNILLTNILDSNKTAIEKIILENHLHLKASLVRQEAMACVALPTCPLAMAEAQRYLPELITKFDDLLLQHELDKESISIRMTGCPNGCARPYLAEIALIGKGPGEYVLRLGGDGLGSRLNQIYKNSVNETEFLQTMNELLGEYKKNRLALNNGVEKFGDFVQRKYFYR